MVVSEKHREEVKRFAKELEEDGWRVILLQGKSPDGIAIKGDKVCAVEVMRKTVQDIGKHKFGTVTRRHWRLPATFTAKRRIYDMFDEVLFSVYYRPDPRKEKTPERYVVGSRG